MRRSERVLLERFLLAERKRHEGVLQRIAQPSLDSPDDRGRPGDDMLFSTAGASADDDRAVVAHATRELAAIDGALTLLHTNPDAYGRCSVCRGPISMERLRLVPGTRYCQSHAHD